MKIIFIKKEFKILLWYKKYKNNKLKNNFLIFYHLNL